MGDSTLAAVKRDTIGKKVKQLRAKGHTPAVIHDHGSDSIHIAVPEAQLKKVYASSGKHHPVDVTVDKKKYTTMIKEVTYKPATASIYHTVFQAIKADEKAAAEVPLQLVGEIPAEKASLQVLKKIDRIEIEALPKDLIDVIEVDATSLAEVGDKLTVADLKVPATVRIKTEPEQVIATVEMPKDQAAEADAAAADLASEAGEESVEGEEAADTQAAEAASEEE